MNETLRFPDWYYGGPHLRVENPDADLPRRDTAVPISPERRAQTESNETFDGQRLVAPFGDSNSLDEILPLLLLIADYPDAWDDDERFVFPTIQGLLAEVVLRLEMKLRHKPGRVRTNWFNHALRDVREASVLFAGANYQQAQDHIQHACDLIRAGNKAARRKVSFIAGPDGTVRR